MIYLDQAATSWPKPPNVLAAVQEALKSPWGNPGRSGYPEAIQAAEKILACREALATLFHVENPLRFCFTSNATEALNLAIKGSLKSGDHVVCSGMEHNAVWRPLVALSQSCISYSHAQADADGRVSVEAVLKELRPNTRLVAILHASNVCGTINPIAEIGDALRGKDCLFLVDASQSAGALSIDVEEMQIDLLAFPGHKGLLGPQGTGGLYIRDGITLTPLREGGTGSDSALPNVPKEMPDRYETGTLNTPGIAGLHAGLKYLLKHGIQAIADKEQQLTQELLAGLSRISKIRLYGPPLGTPRAPVVSFTIRNRSCTQVCEDLANRFCIDSRPGLHCAYLAHRTLATEKTGTIRFSIGHCNIMDEIQQAIESVEQLAKEG